MSSNHLYSFCLFTQVRSVWNIHCHSSLFLETGLLKLSLRDRKNQKSSLWKNTVSKLTPRDTLELVPTQHEGRCPKRCCFIVCDDERDCVVFYFFPLLHDASDASASSPAPAAVMT